ncbi:uncharacterized protein LOC123691709 [Colias croceus]|uniref:uncharacterized protein LOC123691709 n=1 Tax=Colias crocea TaxID=72248 RepID=UPI001E27CD84|nr:uncharacterized protein LOC123691709 [Colias croceus]
MWKYNSVWICLSLILPINSARVTNFYTNKLDCGPYGFVCDGVSRLRICEEGNMLGPAFLCPSNTICNEESNEVCENIGNYIDPVLTKNVRCYRNERIADPNVPGCKGYILCIPNKNRFQGLKFQCTGRTVFNGYTRACTSPDKYRCPMGNNTSVSNKFYSDGNKKGDTHRINGNGIGQYGTRVKPVECENYNFAVTDDEGPVRVTYFCPQRPAKGEYTIRCTLFSNNFCISLEKDEEDQFLQGAGTANRRPRENV